MILLNVDDANGDDKSLTVLTWNVLQDIFIDSRVYPSSGGILEPSRRHSIFQQRLATIATDVIFLQELGRSVLDDTLAGSLITYEHHFVPVGVEAQTFNGHTDEWGVCILWRPAVMLNVQKIDLGIRGCYGTHPVACIHADVLPWGEAAIFVCVHLDGEGCPPSVTRAQEQVCEISAAVDAAARRLGITRIVWGGDFNQPRGTPALCDAARVHGLHIVSGEQSLPTCHVPVSYSRIDHILASGVRCSHTAIPAYPGGGGGVCRSR